MADVTINASPDGSQIRLTVTRGEQHYAASFNPDEPGAFDIAATGIINLAAGFCKGELLMVATAAREADAPVQRDIASAGATRG